MAIDQNLLKFCTTDTQTKNLEAYIRFGNQQDAADHLGITRRTMGQSIQRIKAYALHRGYDPANNNTNPVQEGHFAKGVSTLYDEDGNVKLQWVKSNAEVEDVEAKLKLIAEELGSTIKKEKPRPAPKSTMPDLLSCYVITDFHLGMKAWGEETQGDDWDTDIAENMLVNWFGLAIAKANPTETAIFAQLGDFLHWDGMDAVTPQSKHLLDADTRFGKIVRVAIRAFRRIIGLLLAKHKYVHVVMAEGNHDPASSVWFREWLHAMYDNEPRVTVDNSSDIYYCYEFGQTSLFFHHGHKRKVANVDSVFAAKYRDVFGRTKFSYGHMGHLHHDHVKETNLMTVEQHRTLASADAYASRGGWLSGRDAKVIEYHKEFGEVGRYTISADMVNA